ncbi:hypothetical protein RHSIM_Rhsim13G0117800 [Rhododendron simsii]|uniref:Uncharacterized protein n=1 Tax=Rhododendron simsii TaxID=118357 RepID=A0A834FX65_RHOSS|nr:hypothetical protein RHSIM_Rhsim13G0117800 [Rhododendron simsii]
MVGRLGIKKRRRCAELANLRGRRLFTGGSSIVEFWASLMPVANMPTTSWFMVSSISNHHCYGPLPVTRCGITSWITNVSSNVPYTGYDRGKFSQVPQARVAWP